MTFDSQDFLLFDVQTTGTNPETSAILEIGWGIYRAALDPLSVDWQVSLVKREESTLLTRRVQKLTGLTEKNWEQEATFDLITLRQQLHQCFLQHPNLPVLLHYARFKKPFLFKVLGLEIGSSDFLHQVICTYELAKLRLPALKSYSLRAVAGFAGFSLGDKKRSRDHLIATAFVWRHLIQQTSSPAQNPAILPLHAENMRVRRLALPAQPGVYYFLDHAGRILYIGKAANLKHRLNSYFRGQKTKGSRLNEMLTRAVDFNFHIVGSELEALLLESDEVKRWNPPYNRLLKSEGRLIHTFRLNSHLHSPVSWGDATWGPFTHLAGLHWLLQLAGEASRGDVQVWSWVHELFSDSCIKEGLRLLFDTDNPLPDQFRASSLSLWEEWRQKAEDEPEEDLTEAVESESPSEEVAVATPEQAAAFIQQTLLGLMRQLQRARWMLRLMECSIEWKMQDREPIWLQISNGQALWNQPKDCWNASHGWQKSRKERLQSIDVTTYDRLAILLSELRRGVRRGDSIQLSLRPGWVLSETDLLNHFYY